MALPGSPVHQFSGSKVLQFPGSPFLLFSSPAPLEWSHSPKSILNVDGFLLRLWLCLSVRLLALGFGLFMPSARPSTAIEFDIVLGAQVPRFSPPFRPFPWPPDPYPSAMKVNCHLHLYPCEWVSVLVLVPLSLSGTGPKKKAIQEEKKTSYHTI